MRRTEQEPLEDVLGRLRTVHHGKGAGSEVTATGDLGASSGGRTDGMELSMLPLLATICMVPRNEPEDFARLFRFFARLITEQHSGRDSSSAAISLALSKFVLRLRTALFKAVPLVGVPRIINAQASLYGAVSSHEDAEAILSHLPKHSTKPTKTTEEDSTAGWAFFKAIYERHADRIIDRIGKTSPDLAEMIVDELYGANLSRTEVLTWQETVLIEFVGCASLDCPAQTKGHFYGCKNLGVGKQDVQQAIDILRALGAWRGEPLREERLPFLQELVNWTA